MTTNNTFEFNETVETTTLTYKQVEETINKFNLEVKETYKFGNLLIEEFIDDDLKTEYDISLEIYTNSFKSRTFKIKTSSNLEALRLEYRDILNSFLAAS